MRKGFTLVELSIVLVIIGLLVSGILVAQSLIESAKVGSYVRQINQYSIALRLFKDRYRYAPGDINLASFPNPGNGNGIIDYADAARGNVGEWTRAWQHLSVVDMLEEDYTGDVPLSADSVPTLSGLDDAYFTLINFVSYGYRPEGQAMVIGSQWLYDTTWNASGVFSPAFTMSMDVKIDDGKPDSGDVVNYCRESYNPGCVTGTVGTDPYTSAESYDIDNEDGLCSLLIFEPYWEYN